MHSSKFVAVGFLSGALVVGASIGYAADRFMLQRRICAPATTSERGWRQLVYEDLELSVEQRAKWDSLFAERRRAVSAANATIRPRVDSIHDDYRRDVQAMLNPTQRERLAQRQKEIQQAREKEQLEQQERQRARADTARDRR
jgi:hypothetical protein